MLVETTSSRCLLESPVVAVEFHRALARVGRLVFGPCWDVLALGYHLR